MVKKISYILIAVAIAVAGFIGLKKLNYWERSVWIFKLDNKTQSFEGRGGRGGGDSFGRPGQRSPHGFEREGVREMPLGDRREPIDWSAAGSCDAVGVADRGGSGHVEPWDSDDCHNAAAAGAALNF